MKLIWSLDLEVVAAYRRFLTSPPSQRTVMGWVYQAIAIVAEVIGTAALKPASGFTRPVASAVVIVGYATAFVCLSLALKVVPVPVGIIYAIWSGVGIVLLTIIAHFSGERMSAVTLSGIALIIVGIVVVKLSFEVG